MEKINITYSKWNLANNYGEGHIELNENLQKPEFIELKKSILDHELRHNKTDFKGDLIVDLGEHKVSNVTMLKFLIKHPKALTQFLPITYHKKYGLCFDGTLILTYGLGIITVIILYLFLH